MEIEIEILWAGDVTEAEFRPRTSTRCKALFGYCAVRADLRNEVPGEKRNDHKKQA